MSVVESASIGGPANFGHRHGGPGVCSAARVLAVLKYLARKASPVPAREIARECQVPKSSLYQLLSVMRARRFVTYYPLQRSWGLGLASFQVGGAALRESPLERLGVPVLNTLAAVRADGVQSAHLAVLRGNEVENLLTVTAPHDATDLGWKVGVRLPAHLTAVGRAMLMHFAVEELETIYRHSEALPAGATPTSTRVDSGGLSALCSQLALAREVGYVVDEQPTAGISTVAAAVFDCGGHAIAGVGVGILTRAHGPASRMQLVAEVRQAARTLSAHLGWQEDRSTQ